MLPPSRRPVRRLRLRDAAVPAVGGAVGDARDDELRQPGALRFRHARRLRHRHADERARLAVPRHAAVAPSWPRRWRAWCSSARSTAGSTAPSDLDQVLLTIGLVFISVAVAACFFGTDAAAGRRCPPICAAHSTSAGSSFGVYRLFLIAIGAGRHARCWSLALEYTRFGAQVRAAVDNQRMARGLGIDVDRTFAFTFALGSGPRRPRRRARDRDRRPRPAFAFTYLVYVLIVVSVGGLGSIGGSFAAAACSASATWPANTTCRSSAPS